MKQCRSTSVYHPALWVACAFAACSGNGSDIGPRLAKLPGESCKVVVLDDAGRGVVSATVSVVGTPISAITGRNGRGDFLASPRGRALCSADGANGAAVAGDRLATLRVALSIIGADLPSPLWLPSLPAIASTITLGTQAAATAIPSSAGGILTVPTGSSVGLPGAVGATVAVRTGVLQAQHLPGDLPVPATGAILFGGGLFVDPPAVTFTPAANIDLADDLGLGNALATLYHLDDTTGEWTAVATAATATAGRITKAVAVATGGLYAFGVAVAATTVSGRVVDGNGEPVPDVMVSVDAIKVVTDGAGRFVATGVPATRGDGAPRAAAIELFAGGGCLPARATASVAVAAASTEVGDFTLDTMSAGNVRVQQVVRGRGDSLQPAGISSLRGDVALAVTSDADGQVLFEDLPAEWFGFQEGRPADGNEVFYAQSVGFLERGRRWLDAYQFFFQQPRFLGTRRSRTIVTDSLGGGPVQDAAVVRGAVPGAGLIGITQQAGAFFVDRDFEGRATASLRSQRGGRTIVHAFSIDRPDGEHLELPLLRVLRAPLGAFDRHGLVAGTLLGADPSRLQRLRVTRRISLQEWWDDVVEGVPIPSSLPIDVDPATTHAAFQAGVAVAGGNLAAAEVTTAGGITTLQKAGIADERVPSEGGMTQIDIALDLTATTTFVVANALTALDPDIVVANLRFALALEQPSGRVVDVVRELGGNLSSAGNDLQFQLPELTGSRAGSRWLALVQGTSSSGAATLRHSSVIRLPSDGASGFALPTFPTISFPPPSAMVAATGFTVGFTLPACQFGKIELRSDAGGELLLWQAIVPPDQTQFTFVQLPSEAATPLVAGRTYELTVSAYRGFSGPLIASSNPYRDYATFVQSIGFTEGGVEQVSRRTVTITTN